MATNQGLLQAQIKVKNTIDLNNAFSSPSIANPQLKSIEGDLNLSNEYALQSFNSSNTNTQYIDTIKTNSSNTSLKDALNNLPNLKYIRLEGSYESKGNSFDNNTNLQKVDLSESLTVKPEDFKANENLKTLPNLDYSNPDLTDIITNDTNLLPTTFDISNEPNTNKLGIHGDSTHQLGNLEFVKVNPEAPFDNQITPQIDVSYTSLDRNGLVNLFNTMPYNVGYQVVGSPTIVNGVLLPSDKTTNTNYIKIAGRLNLNNDYEIQYKFKLSSGAQSATYPFPLQNTSTGYMNVNYNPGISGKPIQFLVYPAGAGWHVLGSNNFTFEEEVDYWIRIVKNSNNYKLYISTDGLEFALNNKVTFSDLPSNLPTINQLNIGQSSASNRFLLGSIDIKESYIKVNSQISTGPVDYTVVGSPTIVDGVVSGFSENNIITVTDSKNIFNTSSTIEEKVTFTPITLNIRQGISGCNASQGSFGFELTSSNKILFRVSYLNTNSETRYLEVTVNYVVSSNTKYAAVATFNRADFSVTVSLYDSNNTLLGTNSGSAVNPDTTRFEGSIFNFGYNQRGTFMGSIDLNQTYIKVNGQLWFGHESKQVTWFNGKPSQIKEVDITGATGTSSLTNDDKAIVTNKGWTLIPE